MAKTDNTTVAKVAVDNIKSLREEIKRLKSEMANYDAGSKQFQELAHQAGEAQHKIQDIQAAIRGASSDFGDMLGNVGKVGAGITGAFQTASAALSMFGVESEEVTQSIKTMQNMMAMTQGLAAIDESMKAMKKLSASIQGTTVAAKALKAAMTPKVFLAIVAAITALTYAFRKLTESQKKAAEEQKATIEEAVKAEERYRKSVVDNVVKSITSYRQLQLQYQQLKTEYEKTKWIKDNADAFKNLGVQVNTVSDAENLLITNTDAFVKSLMLRAKAAAYAKKAEEEYAAMIDQQEASRGIGYAEAPEIGSRVIGFNPADYVGGMDYNSETGWTWNAQGVEQRKKEIAEAQAVFEDAAERFLTTSNNLMAEADELLKNAGIKQIENTGKEVKNAAKEVKEVKDTWAQDAYAEIEYNKVINEEYAKSKAALEDLLYVQEEELKSLEVGSAAWYNLSTKIEETKQSIDKFGQAVEKTPLEKLDLQLLSADLQHAQGSLSDTEYWETVIDLETQKLFLMEAETEEWYNQAIAIENYKAKLAEANDTSLQHQESIRGIQQVASAALGGIADMFQGLSDLQDTTTKEGFEKQKKLGIAAATINMLQGIATAIAGAFTTKSGPWDIALAAIQAASIGAAGAIQIAKIKKQTFDGANSGGASANVSSSVIKQFTAPVQLTRDIQGASIESAIKDSRVYVVESDITNTQRTVDVQQSENRY